MKCAMQSAIAYFGGKGQIAHLLLPLLPEHRTYVEVFGGGASLLHAKLPSPVEVYNDLDGGVVNFWRVLRDPEKFEAFQRQVALTPHSRAEYYLARGSWRDATDSLAAAVRFYVAARQSFSGEMCGGWGYSRSESSSGMARNAARWLKAVERLDLIHERWMRVQIEQDDFRKIIPRYDGEDVLFYLDPPYVPETRRKTGRYRCEMTLADHEDLVRVLLGLQGKCLLSGYVHPAYAPLEDAGWKRVDLATSAHAAGRTRSTGLLGKGAVRARQPRTESIWLSPNAISRP